MYYMGDYYLGDPGRRGGPARAQVVAKGVHTSPRKIATRTKTSHPAGQKQKRPGLLRRGLGAFGRVSGGAIETFGGALPGVGGALAGPLGRAIKGGGERLSAEQRKELGLPRRRRMNIGNAKALRRAIRRATGFAKLARRVLRFTSAKPPKGRVYFKATHRKK